MSRASFPVAAFAAAALGTLVAQLALDNVAFRDSVAMLFGRGHLLALVRGHGIYEVDLGRRLSEERDANGGDAPTSRRSLLQRLVSETMSESLARNEHVDPAAVTGQIELLRAQFPDEKRWQAALGRSGFSAAGLRQTVRTQLRARRWLERQLGPIKPSSGECEQVFNTERLRFDEPERFRASHLFLAAPADTPAEVVDLKRKAIGSLRQRLGHGEDFFELVAQASEDEATKTRGGDLGWFCDRRMPPDFMAAVRALQVGGLSGPVRTRLGFHIVKVSDRKAARAMTFQEVAPEIELELANARRADAVRALAAKLIVQASFVRTIND